MNFLERAISVGLPYIIALLEIMGIFIVAWSALKAFWEYIQNTFMHRDHDLQYNLATGLATGLEFKVAAEILKTVLIQDLKELLILGAVILLRALIKLFIHFELEKKDKRTKQKENGEG